MIHKINYFEIDTSKWPLHIQDRFEESIEDNSHWYSDRNKDYVIDDIIWQYNSDDQDCWDEVKKQFYVHYGDIFTDVTGFNIIVKNFAKFFPGVDNNRDVLKRLKDRNTISVLYYLLEKLPKDKNSDAIDELLDCFYFKVEATSYAEIQIAISRIKNIFKKWLVGIVKLWDNAFKGVTEDAELITPLLLNPVEGDAKYFYQHLLIPEHFRYFETSPNLKFINRKLYTNLLVAIPDIHEMDESQIFQIWYYHTIKKCDSSDHEYPLGDEQQRCATLILTAETIPKGLNPFIQDSIVPFEVGAFYSQRFLKLDKEKLWSQIVTLYKNNFDWKLDEDDREFIYNYSQNLIKNSK